MPKNHELQGQVAQLMQRYGSLPNIFQAQLPLAPVMVQHEGLFRVTMYQHSPLSRRLRELIGLAVVARLGCHYCIEHHRDSLVRLSPDEEVLAEQLTTGEEPETLSVKEKAAVKYAVRLTTKPMTVAEIDRAELAASGWTPEEMVAINAVVAYFNYSARVAIGLGVELEEAIRAGAL